MSRRSMQLPKLMALEPRKVVVNCELQHVQNKIENNICSAWEYNSSLKYDVTPLKQMPDELGNIILRVLLGVSMS